MSIAIQFHGKCNHVFRDITLYNIQHELFYNTLILLERSKTCRETLAQRQLKLSLILY